MKRFLIPLLTLIALPTTVNANVDLNVHEMCLKAKDYKGCVDLNKSSVAKDLPLCEGNYDTWNECFGIKKFRRHELYQNDIYEGEWKDGRFDGQGTYTSKRRLNKYVYKGSFKKGKFDGPGIMTANNAVLITNFIDGEIEGEVIINYPNGDKLIGNASNNQINGNGKYLSANGDKYEGDLKDGKINGQGRLTLANGNEYIGEFKNGLYHGRGVYISKNGRKDTGEFIDGQLNGEGVTYWPNGAKYTGSFKNWQRHGKGTAIYKDGSTWTGVWKKDKPIEEEYSWNAAKKNNTYAPTSQQQHEMQLEMLRLGTDYLKSIYGNQNHHRIDIYNY